MDINYVLLTAFTFANVYSSYGQDEGCNYCISSSCTASIVPAAKFDARSDRLALQKATKGMCTKKATLIQILTARTDYQRLEIARDYIQTGKTLMTDVSSVPALLALTKPLDFFYASELRNAIKTVNYKTVAEILSTLSGCAIQEISVMYQIMYRVSLFNEISRQTKGSHEKLMLALASGSRDSGEEVDQAKAKTDAATLISSGVKSWFTGNDKFIEIFTRRSFSQLKETVSVYDNTRKKKDKKNYISIFKDLGELFKKDHNLNYTYSTIVRVSQDPNKYFQEELETALTKKDHVKVIRIIRGRSEVDLADISKKYKSVVGKPLSKRIKERTGGNLQKTLLAIVK